MASNPQIKDASRRYCISPQFQPTWGALVSPHYFAVGLNSVLDLPWLCGARHIRGASSPLAGFERIGRRVVRSGAFISLPGNCAGRYQELPLPLLRQYNMQPDKECSFFTKFRTIFLKRDRGGWGVGTGEIMGQTPKIPFHWGRARALFNASLSSLSVCVCMCECAFEKASPIYRSVSLSITSLENRHY